MNLERAGFDEAVKSFNDPCVGLAVVALDLNAGPRLRLRYHAVRIGDPPAVAHRFQRQRSRRPAAGGEEGVVGAAGGELTGRDRHVVPAPVAHHVGTQLPAHPAALFY